MITNTVRANGWTKLDKVVLPLAVAKLSSSAALAGVDGDCLLWLALAN